VTIEDTGEVTHDRRRPDAEVEATAETEGTMAVPASFVRVFVSFAVSEAT